MRLYLGPNRGASKRHDRGARGRRPDEAGHAEARAAASGGPRGASFGFASVPPAPARLLFLFVSPLRSSRAKRKKGRAGARRYEGDGIELAPMRAAPTAARRRRRAAALNP